MPPRKTKAAAKSKTTQATDMATDNEPDQQQEQHQDEHTHNSGGIGDERFSIDDASLNALLSGIGSTDWAALERRHVFESHVWPRIRSSDDASLSLPLALVAVALLTAKAAHAANPQDVFECVGDDDDHTLARLFTTLATNLTTTTKTTKNNVNHFTHIQFARLLSLGCASMERRVVRKATLNWLSLPTWASVGQRRRDQALVESGGKLAKHWQAAVAKQQHTALSACAFPALLHAAVDALAHIGEGDANDSHLFVGSVLALLLDIESQLATRRFAWLVVDASRILPAAHVALHNVDANLKQSSLDVVRRHLALLLACHLAPIDAFRGAELTADELDKQHSACIHRLQRVAFVRLQALPAALAADIVVKDTLDALALGNAAGIDQRKSFTALLDALDQESLTLLAHDALLIDDDSKRFDIAVLREALLQAHERPRDPQLEASALSLFPDERQLFDAAYLPDFDDDSVDLSRVPLALPKLGLQFLSMRDYLLRNFELYRLASTYDVRLDLEEAISLSAPRASDNGLNTVFGGVARMALPVGGCSIDKVDKPRVGERKPSRVVASVATTLASLPSEWAAEWDALQRHDSMFLVTLSVRHDSSSEAVASLPFAERYGVVAVRGCTLMQLADGNDKSLLDAHEGFAVASGKGRKLTLHIDTAQYDADVQRGATLVDRIYSRINLLVRRKREENTFKSALEAVRDLVQQHDSVPEWLSDALLGYGDPTAAASGYYNIDADVDNATVVDTIDAFDTFLDANHVCEAFAGRTVVFDSTASAASVASATADEHPAKKSKKSNAAVAASDTATTSVLPPFRVIVPRNASEPVHVSTYEPTTTQSLGLRNAVRFTPRQIEAIVRGMLPGLTLVVGPPGTGKTDCAAQIVSNLYHAHPQERILLVTHSNAALNHLFDKLVVRDIDHRHMLRLGHGAEQLAANEDFSRFGRVSHTLARRLALLGAASELAHSLPSAPLGENDVDSCQLADHLFTQHVRPLFDAWVALGGRTEYPFAAWERARLGLAPNTPLLPGDGDAASAGNVNEARVDAARKLFNNVSAVFDELRDCRAFEIMRTATHRSDYLSTHQARIVAMTTTHAAIKRQQLVELGFAFDTVVMEEAAQVLEIDTFVALMLQQRAARLKRITLIGDHRQLPPVVASAALRKHSHFDQSMFGRLVRLGVPAVVLDAQGRARAPLARLFDWRYNGLRTLPALEQVAATAGSPYQLANAGLSYVTQFIDVPDYQGHGETAPVPHFFQNLGEAEYVVALFMYLRLLGHPAHTITLLTTYNGQKQLIHDVVNARCANLPQYGRPGKISTVDKYQGQQNDIVLLSLVRTKSVGHLRDVRRLIVALSRARLGLYVFGRAELFGSCAELKPALSQLLSKPTKLALVRNERYGAVTRSATDESSDLQVDDVVQLSQLVK